MSSQSGSNGGIGFFGLLQVLFIGLKLGHVIDWSWPWVFSPFLFSLGVTVVILAIAALAFFCFAIADSYSKK